MLLLSVLGTDKQTIIEDYLMSNSGKEEKLGKIRKDCEALGMPPEKIEALQFASGGVFEHYMTHAMDTLERRQKHVERAFQYVRIFAAMEGLNYSEKKDAMRIADGTWDEYHQERAD